MKRLQYKYIIDDLAKKMVFLSGPRQVGKTFLAKRIAESYTSPLYLNYDNLTDRRIIKELSWFENTNLLVLDEIHKMPDWKNYSPLKESFTQYA